MKVLSIICYVVAGFFVYMVALLAFTVMPAATIKAGIMFGFSVPAVVALWVGFAFAGFRHNLRDTGIVLLSSSGLTVFLVFSFACLMATDDFKKMMKPEAMALFTDYAVGFGFLATMCVAGFVLFRMGARKPNNSPEPTRSAVR